MVVFHLFEKLRYSNERSTKFESFYQDIEVFGGVKWQNGSSSKITPNRVCVDWVNRPPNYKGLYGILQLLQGSYWDNFSAENS